MPLALLERTAAADLQELAKEHGLVSFNFDHTP
jgi:hypothetical protein